ncbi:MAG: HAD family phosphatase [Arachnia sp.]
MTVPPFSAVLFDCDGVLVASEPITQGVLHEMLGEMGWDLSFEECMRRFVGKSFKDEWHVIHAHTGATIDDEWIAQFRARRNEALRERLEAVPGAVEAARAVAEMMDGRVACVSGADRVKIEMQLEMVGLADVFEGRVFSGMETARSKPAPDVYLAAADAMGIDPATAAVVEDSSAGVRAGIAAGATVLGLTLGGPAYQTPEQLEELGVARVLTSMADLPAALVSFA